MNKISSLSKLNKLFKIFFIVYLTVIAISNMVFAEESVWESELFGEETFYDNDKFSKILKENYINFFDDNLGILEMEVRNELPNASDEEIKARTKELVEEINKHFNKEYHDFFENPVGEIRKRVLEKNPNATEEDIIREIKKTEILTRLHLEFEEITSNYLNSIGIKSKDVKNPYIRILPRVQEEIRKSFGLDQRSGKNPFAAKDDKIEKKHKPSGFFDGAGIKDIFSYNPLETSQKGRGFSDWLDLGDVRVRMLSSKTGFKEEKPFLIGIQFLLLNDEQVLPWRFSGDYGNKLSLNFSQSQNIKDWEIKWPAPQRHVFGDKNIFGYKKMVILPVLVTPINKDEDIIIKTNVDFELCSDICNKYAGDVPLITVSKGFFATSTTKTAIERFIKDVTGIREDFLNIEDVYLDKADNSLVVKAFSNRSKKDIDIFIENDKGIRFLKPSIMIKADDIFFRIPVDADTIPEEGMLGAELKLTVKNNVFWVEKDFTVKKEFNDQIYYPYVTKTLLLLALLVGFWFNLYPPLFVFNLDNILLSRTFGAFGNNDLKKVFVARFLGTSLFFAILGGLGKLFEFLNYNVIWSNWFKNGWFLLSLAVIMFIWLLFRFGRLKPLVIKSLFVEFGKGFIVSLLSIGFLSYFVEDKINFALFYGNLSQSIMIFTALFLGAVTPHLFYLVSLWDNKRSFFTNISFVQVKDFGNIVLLVSFLWFVCLAVLNLTMGQSKEKEGWLAYSPEALKTALLDNKMVFLEITSNTCVACNFLDFYVIEGAAATKYFSEDNVVKMRINLADDFKEGIQVLKKFGKSREPVYAFFTPSYPDGYVIEETIGVDTIRRTINKLKKDTLKDNF